MIVELKPWVKMKLISHSKLRDSNELLYYLYLKEVLNYDIDTKSVKEFLQDMGKRKIPYLDSIARASRSVQEHNPYLRGELWGKRKKKSVDVKHEIIADK
jgi:hypothetical protein